MHVNNLLNDQRPLLASSQDFPLDSRGTLRALLGQGCMEQTKVDGFGKRKALTRWQRDQLIDGGEAGAAIYQLAVRVFLLLLGAACAAVGLVLITILVR